MKVTLADPMPIKVRTESPFVEIWYPSWDTRKGDFLFHPNEGGRFINMSTFNAFLLPRDQDMLVKADVEEALGVAMGHILRV